MTESRLLKDTPSPHTLLLSINRPESMNALDEALCQELDAALAAAARDEDVRCIILTGEGNKAFSAGYDVKELSGYTVDEFVSQNVLRYEWIWNIAAHPKPVIAANPGIAVGAGAIMLVSADIRVGTEDSIIRFTSTPHGSAMLTWNLPQITGWSKAKEYLMTSCKISSSEALSSSLLNHVTTQGNLIPKALELAEMICACEPSGPQDVKRLMREHMGKSQRDQMQTEMNELLMQQFRAGNRVGDWYSDLINK